MEKGSKLPKKITVSVNISIPISWYPEDFLPQSPEEQGIPVEGSDSTYEGFVKRMREDEKFRFETFQDNALDLASDLVESALSKITAKDLTIKEE